MLRCQCPSVRLSVTEVHWRIIANLGFKFRYIYRALWSRCMPGRRERSSPVREEGSSRAMLATARPYCLYVTGPCGGRTLPQHCCSLAAMSCSSSHALHMARYREESRHPGNRKYVRYCNAIRAGPSHVTCMENSVKFGRVVPVTDRQTDRHAYHNNQLPYRGGVTMTSMLITSPPPGRVRSIVMSMYVCLSVCPLGYLRNPTAEFH